MTEQRTDRIETPDGNTHTTTIVTDEPRSGVSGWFLMFVVLLAVGVAIWVFVGPSESETAKDNAVTEAANRVSDTAEQVGNAAAEAGDAAKDAAQSAASKAQDAADKQAAPSSTEAR